MSTSALLAIQQAVYAKLTGDATLMGLTKVYDFVPQGTPYPYVVIGEATEAPEDTLLNVGRECTITLHIWSDAAGNTQALTILNRLNVLLDEQPLTVTGWVAWWVKYEFGTTLRDDTTLKPVRHAVPRYRIHLQEA